MKTSKFLISAGLVVALASCSSGEQQQQAPAPSLATMTIALGNSEINQGYPATIKGKTDIDIRPQVTGFITRVHVDEGQRVHRGQVLFSLDRVQYQAAVEQAQAAIAAAQTAVQTAQLTADNKRTLLEKNIISQYEWQLADNQLRQAKAQLAQANAALVSARKNLSYTTVTAPSSGVVGTIPNREGSLASPSSAMPLTTVSDNSEVYAYFSLNEKDVLDLTNNGAKTLDQAIKEMPAVQLQLSNGEIFANPGKIATVSGVIDNATGAATVRAIFDNTNGMLRSGSTGKVLIPRRNDNIIMIPQSATSELQDRRFAYVVNDSNKIVQTPITVSDLDDGKNFIVTSGLKAGDRIVIEGIGVTVKDGITINPVDPNAKGATAPEAKAAEQKK